MTETSTSSLRRPIGVGVALEASITSDGAVEADETGRRAWRCVQAGGQFVVLGCPQQERPERRAVDLVRLAAAAKSLLPETPVLLQIGDLHAGVALELTCNVARARVADGLLVLAPSDMTADVFYCAVRDIAPAVPLLAYRHPETSAPIDKNLEARPLPVDGIVDSSASCDELKQALADGAVRYTSNPALVRVASRLGAAGAILTRADNAPRLCRAAWDGDRVAQVRLRLGRLDPPGPGARMRGAKRFAVASR